MWKRTVHSLSLLLAAALVAVAAACAPSAKVAAPAAPPLVPAKEQTWQLVALRGRALDRGGQAPTLVVNPDARSLSGFAYCNTYFYALDLRPEAQEADGDYYAVRLADFGSGDLQCSEAVANAEQRYHALLAKATRLRLTATTLTLFAKDKAILHFELQ